jgi:dTDP-4-amino-4,6-dideoxygalactose transaminase
MKYTRSAEARSRQHLQDITRRQHVVFTGRAATGIWALLRAWDLHDAVVLLPANTCYIVLWAVLKSGNRPLLVDVDRRTGNLTVGGLESQRESHPAVVIPCHMYGLPAPMREICVWAQANNVKVIEDAALALGATIDGQPAGSWGDAAILSFGLGKIVDNQVGGALVTNDEMLTDTVTKYVAELLFWDDTHIALTNQWNGLYWPLHQYESQNPRLLDLYPQLFALYGDLTTYQLADEDWSDLPALLHDLPNNLARRARLAALYDEQLGMNFITKVADRFLQPLGRPSGSILWRYPLLVQPDIRDNLLSYLWEQGIHDATRWYPPLRPMTTALVPQISQPPTPVADLLGASIINLPLDESVDEDYVNKTTTLIHSFLENLS